MDQIFQFLIALVMASATQGLVQDEPILIGGVLMSNDTDNLKKFEYDHIKPIPQEPLDCSNVIANHDYILLANGSLFLPGSDSVHEYGTYFVQNSTAYLCEEDSVVEQTTEAAYNFSDEFLSCGHLLLEPNEFLTLENGDIYVPIYSKTYGPRDYFLQDGVGVYVCMPQEMHDMFSNFTNYTYTHLESKFPDSFNYFTYVGLTISVVSLLLHLVVFCAVSAVRNLPGCCLASLSLSLLAAYSCFLIASYFSSSVDCAKLGMCIYYFFLTSFFWMNAIAFDVWRSFRVVVRELRISSHRVPWRRFLLYSIYSWSIPALLTVMVNVFNTSELLPEDLRPSFGVSFCWFGQRKALLVFFAAPLIFVMVMNAVFFLDVTYVISRATLKTSQSHQATLKKRFFMFMRLAFIMGLTWIVGLVAGYADNIVLWCLFILLNTLQGLFILVVFSFSSKVRGLFFKGFKKRKGQGTSTSVRTISQVSASV